MKKWLSWLLLIVMLVSSIPAWGDETADAVFAESAETSIARTEKEVPAAETRKEAESSGEKKTEEKKESIPEEQAAAESSPGEESSDPAQQNEDRPSSTEYAASETGPDEEESGPSLQPAEESVVDETDDSESGGEQVEETTEEGDGNPAEEAEEGSGEDSDEHAAEAGKPSEGQEEAASQVFEAGYARLKKGARLFFRKDRTGLLGILEEDAAVYILALDEASGTIELVLAAEGEALQAWAAGEDAVPLTEEEIRKLESGNVDLIWQDTVRLINASIELRISEEQAEAPEEQADSSAGEPAEDQEADAGETDDPEADPEPQDLSSTDEAEDLTGTEETAEGGETADGEEEAPLTEEEFNELLAKEELTPPTLVLAGGNPAIRLSWNQVNATNGYQIERRQLTGTKWTADWIEVFSNSDYRKTQYTDSSTELGQVYQYRICSRSRTGEVSEYKESARVFTYSPAGNSFRVEDAKQNLKNLCWDKVDGATGYFLNRTGGGSDIQIKITSAKTVKYTDKKVELNTTYTYSLLPYRKAGKEIYTPLSWSDATSSIYPMTAPVLTSVVQIRGGTQLTWTASDNAEGYTVYYAENPPADESKIKWKKAGAVKNTVLTYTVKDKVSAKKGLVIRKYKVVATAKLGGTNKMGPFDVSDPVYRMGSPEKVTVTRLSDKNRVRVSWDQVKDAEGYIVYHRTGSDGVWKEYKCSGGGTLGYTATVTGAVESWFEVCAYTANPSTGKQETGSPSTRVSIVPCWYYTLIVEQVNYDPDYANPLEPCAMDGQATEKTLAGQSVDIKHIYDSTASGITSAISSFLGRAEKDDVVVFYYTGHGSSDGSLYCMEDTSLSTAELHSAFESSVKSNHVIIIVDACYSGMLIDDANFSKDLISKNAPPSPSDFTNAFTGAFSDRIAKSGEFANSTRYNVIAACSMFETSKCNTSLGSIATYYLNKSGGYDAKSRKTTAKQGDKNKDKVISVQEAYNYASPKAASYVKSHPLRVITDYFWYRGRLYYYYYLDKDQHMKYSFTEPWLTLYY